ncbi:MAG: hypothetical protein LC733_07240 [Actinobacteria bacterium]|nr:hypothetical protein [Actinomycetota bacterium]
MDFGKIDAALAAALDDVDDRNRAQLSVFVHLDPALSAREREELRDLGLANTAVRGGITTATLSVRDIDELSEQPSVRQLRLSAPLRLLREE